MKGKHMMNSLRGGRSNVNSGLLLNLPFKSKAGKVTQIMLNRTFVHPNGKVGPKYSNGKVKMNKYRKSCIIELGVTSGKYILIQSTSIMINVMSGICAKLLTLESYQILTWTTQMMILCHPHINHAWPSHLAVRLT